MENKEILNRREEDDIFLRSEEVQEIMGKVPPAILRWGISCIACILLALLVGSFFFEYPETISSEVVISSTILPVEISPSDNGRLVDVYVGNGCRIEMGDTLAALSTGEVIKAPISGVIGFIKPCEVNSTIKTGDALFSIRPDSIGQVFAKGRVTASEVVKMHIGQEAIIRLDCYSGKSFEIVSGKVCEIATVADENGCYYIKIGLNESLETTNFSWLLMKGTADVVINRKRVLERLALIDDMCL